MEGKQGQTEKATAKRREKEREKGNLPISQEVLSVVALLTATFLIRLSFPEYIAGTRRMIAYVTLGDLTGATWTSEWVQQIFFQGVTSVGVVMAPLLGFVMLAGIAGSMGQTGPYFSWGAFKSGGLKAMNPIKGAKKLFSLKSITKLGMTLLKLAVIAGLMWLVWAGQWDTVAQLPAFGLEPVSLWVGRRIFLTLVTVSVMAIVIAVIDVVITRHRHEKAMMMTKHEVKDERKQYEVKPEVKRAQFKKMRELTMSKLVSAVPEATVVITNPIRVAVALRYDPATMDTPKVVAKGLRLRAARIRELAREHNIPIVERPPLARALYKSVKVGRNIPATLFEGVAEVLAYLHRLGYQLRGMDTATLSAMNSSSNPAGIR